MLFGFFSLLKIDALKLNANHKPLPEQNLLIVIKVDGGGRRDRTDDIQLAKLALSQLSYAPYITVPLSLPESPDRFGLPPN